MSFPNRQICVWEREERTERQMTSITNESEYATIAREVEMQSWT